VSRDAGGGDGTDRVLHERWACKPACGTDRACGRGSAGRGVPAVVRGVAGARVLCGGAEASAAGVSEEDRGGDESDWSRASGRAEYGGSSVPGGGDCAGGCSSAGRVGGAGSWSGDRVCRRTSRAARDRRDISNAGRW